MSSVVYSTNANSTATEQNATMTNTSEITATEKDAVKTTKKVASNNITVLTQTALRTRRSGAQAPEDELAKEMTHDLEMNFNKIAPFGKEDTAKELQDHAAK